MKFNATSRSVQGSSASRRLRRAGRVPAIVYGGKGEALSIELDHNEIYHAARKPGFHSSVLEMDLDGKVQNVLLRAVQWHPYKQLVLHVDFQRVAAGQALTTKVPFEFINAEVAPAVKTYGQNISHVVTEIEVTCLPKDLPASIEVDLANLEAGQSIHLSQIKAPKGVEFSHQGEDDLLIAAAIAARGASDTGVEADAAAE